MASKILLADDSITIQKVVNLTFADEGIEVVSVSNGDMAERRLPEVKPDLVLADVFMPGKNGYELCETIKQSPLYRNVPVVLLVGAFEPFDQMEAKRVQADAHLTKPFESRTLVETVRNLITINKGRGTPQPEYRTLNDAAEEEAPAAKAFDVPPPALIPDLPALNIELSSSSAEPVFVEPQVEHSSIPAVTAHEEESPLDLDATSPAPLTLSAEPVLAADMQPQHTRILSSPPLRQTGELVSVRGFETEPDVLEISTEEATAAQPPDQPDEVVAAAESTQPDNNGSGFKIASTFGYAAQEMMLDFEKVDGAGTQPVQQARTEDAETVLDLDIEAPSQTPLSIEVDEPTSSTAFAPEAASSTNGGGAEGLQAEAVEAVSIREGEFVISEKTETAAPTTLLAADEPLGDLLSDESGAEGFASGDVAAVQAPATHFTPEQAAELAAPHAEVLESALPVGAEEPPFEPASLFRTIDEPAEPPQQVGAAEPEAPHAQSDLSDLHREPPQADASFTSSAMWAQEETRFTPIDVEATAAYEPTAQAAILPGKKPAQDADLDETGFEFAHVLPEEPAAASDEGTDADVLAPEPPVSVGRSVELSPATIDEIVRRVVNELSDTVVREIAWDVVPDCVERVIDQMTRDSVAKRL